MVRVTVGRPKDEEEKSAKWPIAAILLAALAVRVVGIGYALPVPASAEEQRVVREGFDFTVREAQKQRAGFTLTGLKPERSDKPLITSYVLAGEYGALFGAGHLLGGFKFLSDYEAYFYKKPALFYILGRLTSALFGLFSIYVVYKLCERFMEWGVGVMAAFFLALEPHHIAICQRATGDTLALLFALVGLYYLINVDEESRIGATFVGTVFIGFAASVIFWYAALLIFALGVYLATISAKYKVSALLFGLPVLLLSFLLGMLLPSGMLLLEWREFIGGFVSSVYFNATTGALTDAARAAEYARSAASVDIAGEGIGWGLIGAGVLGLLWGMAFARHNRMKFVIATMMLAVCGAVFFPWDRETYLQWCYLATVPLAIGAGYVIYRLCWRRWMPATAGIALMAVMCAVVAGQNAAQDWRMATRKASDDTRYAFGKWAMENMPHRSRVLVTPEADVLFRASGLRPGNNWATWREDIMSAWNGRGFWVKTVPAPYLAAKAPEFREYDYVAVDSWSLDRIRAAGPSAQWDIAGRLSKVPALWNVSEAIAARRERGRVFLEALETLRTSSEEVESILPEGADAIMYGPGIVMVKVTDPFPREEIEEESMIHAPPEIMPEPKVRKQETTREPPEPRSGRRELQEEESPPSNRRETGERVGRNRER